MIKISIEKVQKVIDELVYERDEFGERVVSLHYAYDDAIKKLCNLLQIDYIEYEG